MSVSTTARGPSYTADPNDVRLDASRLSHMSTSSVESGVTLGGVEYPVGSRVGKTGTFVIGDPGMFDPPKDSPRSSRTELTAGSNKTLVQAAPIEEKGYSFEEWNWQVIRLSCLVLLFAVMIGLLAAVIGVAIQHSKSCDSPFEWYKGSVFYTIDAPYMADSNNDGIGDFAGMLDKLDYLEFLGVGVVSLGRILSSVPPYWDTYTSFTGVDPRLGQIGALDDFINQAHSESDIKVVLELSPVWTSMEHQWFEDSSEYRVSNPNKYEDFYVWSDQVDNSVPGQWEKNIERNMYYLSLNDTTKPLLNWNSVKLQEEFLQVLTFWLNRGIDGFVMRDLEKVHVSGQDTMRSVIESWRELCNTYSGEDDDDSSERRILVLEQKYLDLVASESVETLARVLSTADLVIAPVVMGTNDTYSLQQALNTGRKYTNRVSGPVTCWEVGGLRGVDNRYVTAVHLYTLMLPGTPMLTAGQEVGLNFRELPFDTLNPHVPILWRSGSLHPYNPGMPLNETTIKALKEVITRRNDEYALRQDSIRSEDEEETEKEWNFEMERINGDTLVLKRMYKRKKTFYFTGNFHSADITNDLTSLSAWGDIVADTSDRYEGNKNLQEVKLTQGQAIVISITN